MTNRVRTELEAAIAAKLPDNTSQDITAADLRSACTDLNDTIFRDDAIALEDKTGRIMLEQGGYLLKEIYVPNYTGSLVSWWAHNETTNSTTRYDSHGSTDLTAGSNILSSTYFPATHIGNYSEGQAKTINDIMTNTGAHGCEGGRDFTAGGWFAVNTANGDQSLMSVGVLASPSYSNLDWAIRYISASNRYQFIMGSTTAYMSKLANSFGAVSTSTWAFIVCEYNANTGIAGISINDGTVDTTSSFMNPVTGGGPFSFGRWQAEYCVSKYDENFFYSRLLTSAEKTWLYNSGSGRAYGDL